MNRVLSFFYLIIAVCMFSCTAPHKEVHRLLAEADSLVWTNADSALHLLASLSHPERLEGEPRARYALLLTQARYRCYIPSVSDSLIDTALEYYRSHPEMADRLATSWYYKGALMKERKAPLDSTITAYKEAEALISQLQDQRLVARIYHSLGQINDGASCYDLAKEYYHKALKMNLGMGDVESQTGNMTNLLGVYMMEDKADSAEWCVNYLQKIVLGIEDSIRKRKIYHNIALCHKVLGNYNEAENYYNHALNVSNGQDQKSKIISSLIGLYVIQDKFKEADSLFCLLTHNGNPDILVSTYYYSYLQAKEKKDLSQIIEYADKYISLSDSLYAAKNSKEILEIQHDFDTAVLKYKSSRLQVRLISLLATALLIIGLLLAYYKRKQKKMYLRFIYLQNELLNSQKQELKNEQETTLLRKKLEDYNYKKEKELKALSNQYILLLGQKEKQMQSMEYSALKTIHQIIEGHQYNPKTDREIVKYCLSLTHKEFINRLELSCPNMKNRIVDVCYLTALGLSIADIAILLQVNEKTIKQYMGRVCEEAGFKECGKKQFYAFMTTLLTPQY